MTADVELLPLPDKVEVDKHLPTGVRIYAYGGAEMHAYARANVAHATAAKDAEIEALEVQIAGLTAQVEHHTAYAITHRGVLRYCTLGMRDAYSDEKVRADAAEARADRLAEALVAERDRWSARKADAIREQAGGMTRGDPEAVARCDAAIQRIDAAIDQARGKGGGEVEGG